MVHRAPGLAMCGWHRACNAAVQAATGSAWSAATSLVLSLLSAGAGIVREGVRKVRTKIVDLFRGVRHVPSAALGSSSKAAQDNVAACEAFHSATKDIIQRRPDR